MFIELEVLIKKKPKGNCKKKNCETVKNAPFFMVFLGTSLIKRKLLVLLLLDTGREKWSRRSDLICKIRHL